jgi:hypothetical protein
MLTGQLPWIPIMLLSSQSLLSHSVYDIQELANRHSTSSHTTQGQAIYSFTRLAEGSLA